MKEKIAGISVLANFVLAVMKLIVGFISSSASVLAEGIHSTMDILSSAISFVGIKISKKPVDKKHPYGHYKFEVLSGLIITIILFFTGLWMIYKAYSSFVNPSEISVTYVAIGVMLFSAIVNEVMARLKINYGKKENSLSLISDGVHSRVDVYTSIAVLIGLFLVRYFGWVYADFILAGLIGLYIIKESFELGKEATDSLLDVSAGEEMEEKIKGIIKKEKISFSDLRTQKKGSIITANFKIKLPSNLKIEDATKISEKLRRKLIKEIDILEYVAIQIESHDFETSYYEPRDLIEGFGKGFGWQKEGKFKNKIIDAQGKGPEGDCVCSKCGYKQKHEKGTPCSVIKCPNCQLNLTRENAKTKKM